ncbi:MAG: ATP-binding protein [Planctomycetota bacterium]
MDVHELWSKPINKVTYEDVVALCDAQELESVILEYKQQFSSDNPGKQIAKLVASLANTQGGVSVWGVEEIDRRPRAGQLGMDLGPDPASKIKHACARLVTPPINVQVSEYLTDPSAANRGFLVVQVPIGDMVPYRYKNIIYERIMDSSEPRPAGLETIRTLLARHDALADVQTRHRYRHVERLETIAGEEPALWIVAGPKFGPVSPQNLEQLHQTIVQISNLAKYRRPFFSSATRHSVLNGIFYRGKGDYQTSLCVDVFGNCVLWDATFTRPMRTVMDRLRNLPGINRNLIRHLRQDDVDSRTWASFKNLELCEIRVGMIQDLTRSIVTSVSFCNALQQQLGILGPLHFCIELRRIRGLPFISRRTHDVPIDRWPYDEQVTLERTLHQQGDLDTFLDDLIGDLFWALGRDLRPRADELLMIDNNDQQEVQRAYEFYG